MITFDYSMGDGCSPSTLGSSAPLHELSICSQDIINLLSHEGVVEYLVNSPPLMDTWLEILGMFQVGHLWSICLAFSSVYQTLNQQTEASMTPLLKHVNRLKILFRV